MEKAISIGFRSGLYGGKKSIQFPCAFSNACAHADLCEDRLSAITQLVESRLLNRDNPDFMDVRACLVFDLVAFLSVYQGLTQRGVGA